MARILDEALERLKHEVSLARLIEAQGVKLISQGKDLACRCPWHGGDDALLHRLPENQSRALLWL